MAPRSKLTDNTVSLVETALLRGAYLETAAAYAGISRSTLFAWLKQGRSDEGDYTDDPYGRFALRVDKALATSELRDLGLIEDAAGEIWQAAAWRLERRWPERYSRRTGVALSTEDGPLVVKLAFDPDA